MCCTDRGYASTACLGMPMGRIGDWKGQADKKRSRKLLTLGAVAGLVLLLFLLCAFFGNMGKRGEDVNASTSQGIMGTEYQSASTNQEDTMVETEEDTLFSTEETRTIPDAMETTLEDMTETVSENQVRVDYIDLVAVGDNLMHRSLSGAGKQPDGSWDYTSVYAPMWNVISGADIAVLNQEVPMAGEEYGIQTYPRFNAPQQLAATMHRMGFDVVTFATNHMLDQGKQGVRNTITYWNEKYPGILTTGIYNSQEERDRVPYVICKGAKIGFLNYTYGTNSGNVGKDTYLINYMKEDLMRADIAQAKEVCDFVIVCLHWGVENHVTPSEQQNRYALICAEAGADVIIGTHPHVVQPVSFVTAENGNRTLVFYSLGNFVSLQDEEKRMLGGIAKLRLRVETDALGGVSVVPETYALDFLVMHYTYNPNIPAYSHMTVFPWESYTDELAAIHGLHDMGIAFSKTSLQKYIDRLGDISGSFEAPNGF